MNTLSLKIPDDLDAALRAACERRHMPKSALVREALEQALAAELEQGAASGRWLSRWRGALRETSENATAEERLAFLLNKHLR
jgi:predicted transcriptional regulator